MNLKFNALDGYYVHPYYLSVYRVLYCLVIIFLMGLPSYAWIGSMLDYLYQPPTISLGRFFHGFPDRPVMLLITVLNLLSFMAMFLGFKAKWTSLTFSITALIGHSFWFSFGKIDHTILWYTVPAFLGFAGWGNYLNYKGFSKDGRIGQDKDPDRNNASLIVFLFAFTIGFSMLSAGIPKLTGGWLNLQSEGTRYHLIRNYLIIDRTKYLADFFLTFKPHIIWKMMDYAALFLELGLIVSLIRVKYFRAFLFMAVIFHIMILLMFNIAFYPNLLAYMLFVDWQKLFSNVKLNISRTFDLRLRNTMFAICIVFTGYWLCFLFLSPNALVLPSFLQSFLTLVSVSEPFDTSIFVLFIIAFIFVCYLFVRQTVRSKAPEFNRQ
jgi:hypothetical protein